MGMVRPELPLLPYGRQWIDDDDVDAVVGTLRGEWLTQGPKVQEFEARLCEVTGAKFTVAVASGTAALHLACLAAGVRRGDTGVTSTVTFVASANCIRYAGGSPAFADIDPDTGLIDLASLEAVVKRVNPKVVIPVDLTGAVPDLPRIREIAKGALVIEDAAHSLGATRGGHKAAGCIHSDMAILSFHPVKHVTTGEGGAITTNDEAIYRELVDLRTHGLTKDPARLTKVDGPWYYEQRALGFNYRITDVQCALGVSQLKKLPDFLKRRRELASLYDRAFLSIKAVRSLKVPVGCSSAYHLYVLRLVPRHGESLSSVAERRRTLFLRLRDANIAPQVHYIPVHTQPDFEPYREGSFPGAEAYYASCISLPLFPRMEDSDVQRVVDAVGEGIR